MAFSNCICLPATCGSRAKQCNIETYKLDRKPFQAYIEGGCYVVTKGVMAKVLSAGDGGGGDTDEGEGSFEGGRGVIWGGEGGDRPLVYKPSHAS